jgi:phi13 family phage major tail protein
MVINMAKKRVKGLSNLRIWPVAVNTLEAYEVGNMIPVPYIQSFEIEPNTEAFEILADDDVYEKGEDLKGYTVTINVVELTGALRAALEGGIYDESSKLYTFKTSSVSPELALGFRMLQSDGSYKLRKYYSFTVSTVNQSPKTKGSSSETPIVLTGSFTQRAFDDVIFQEKEAEKNGAQTWLDSIEDLPEVG